MKSVLVAFGRGVASQFNVRMLLLALLPLCAAAAAWGVLLWLGLQPTIDLVQRGSFPAGSKLLYVHLGGVPAIDGYSYCFRDS